MTLGIFLVILLIGLALYITAVVLLIKYWDQLTDTAKIFGVIGVLPFWPCCDIYRNRSWQKSVSIVYSFFKKIAESDAFY